MLFIFKTMLVVVLEWIHLASGHRCVLGLVKRPTRDACLYIEATPLDHPPDPNFLFAIALQP